MSQFHWEMWKQHFYSKLSLQRAACYYFTAQYFPFSIPETRTSVWMTNIFAHDCVSAEGFSIQTDAGALRAHIVLPFTGQPHLGPPHTLWLRAPSKPSPGLLVPESCCKGVSLLVLFLGYCLDLLDGPLPWCATWWSVACWWDLVLLPSCPAHPPLGQKYHSLWMQAVPSMAPSLPHPMSSPHITYPSHHPIKYMVIPEYHWVLPFGESLFLYINTDLSGDQENQSSSNLPAWNRHSYCLNPLQLAVAKCGFWQAAKKFSLCAVFWKPV